jgi:hypothetical protein
MAIRATTTPADGRRPAPLVTVTVDYPTLAGRVCQLAGTGTVIAPGDITALLAHDDTLIERVVFDGPNHVRDISPARTFRGTLRRILETTHPRCDHPTCFVPAKDCQGDHITPWSHGGTTSQHNGRMACAHHNRLWYLHPHLQPPPRQPTLEPPHDADPSGADQPADHPPRLDPPAAPPSVATPPAAPLAGLVPPGDDPPDTDPPGPVPAGADPPARPPPAGNGSIDDPARRPRWAPTAAPRGPDLAFTDGDTTCQIWLAA